ncbi:galectin-8-like [Brienomyrus brachyistius]|uniref:galectin-8-like n=1 Tax=Brienomyrus brachyistius TaxID=42636 RepID=UPI0020B224C2|nr:galectin-8-like [Brienomyrus brachyistius]XP_048861600.1 galectin-8-like [Brienomyrus brachyistius]
MSVANPKQTFLNPTVPFAGTILGGLRPGEMVLIQGTVLSDADRFQVDLSCGSSTKPRADIAFHFNPRFKRSPYIVCNSLHQERWGKEEIHYQMPFQQGAAFEIIILVQKVMFKVAVNGGHLLEYKHRLDLDKVDTIGVFGKVKLQAIGFIPASSPTLNPPSSLVTKAVQSNAILSESGDLSLPYIGRLLRGLDTGNTLTVKGQISLYPHSFTVNLRISDTKDIALHLNPRIKAGVFVRNSFLGECWGPEENTLPIPFPFHPGKYFEIIVRCEAHLFKVAVNGEHVLDYKHRVQDVNRIDELEIVGDLQLLDVKLWCPAA